MNTRVTSTGRVLRLVVPAGPKPKLAEPSEAVEQPLDNISLQLIDIADLVDVDGDCCGDAGELLMWASAIETALGEVTADGGSLDGDEAALAALVKVHKLVMVLAVHVIEAAAVQA